MQKINNDICVLDRWVDHLFRIKVIPIHGTSISSKCFLAAAQRRLSPPKLNLFGS